MNNIEDKAISILNKLEALTTQYTPEVMDAAITSVKVTATGNLVMGFIGLGAAFAVLWLAKNFTTHCRAKRQEDGWMSNWDVGAALTFFISGVISGIMAVFSIWTLFDVWNWVAVFNPKLALAHKILGL